MRKNKQPLFVFEVENLGWVKLCVSRERIFWAALLELPIWLKIDFSILEIRLRHPLFFLLFAWGLELY